VTKKLSFAISESRFNSAGCVRRWLRLTGKLERAAVFLWRFSQAVAFSYGSQLGERGCLRRRAYDVWNFHKCLRSLNGIGLPVKSREDWPISLFPIGKE
jgi:hypothetical protein